MEKILVVMCCVCQRIKRITGDGVIHWVEAMPIDKGNVSHGYCPHCAAVAKIDLAIGLDGSVQRLVSFVSHMSSEIAEAGLEMRSLTSELISDGFILKFSNEMELGLREYHGLIFYHGRDELGVYSGQVRNQEEARKTYDEIIDMLLSIPPFE